MLVPIRCIQHLDDALGPPGTIPVIGYASIDMGIQNPKIAVAGLNPHAGENGMFGREEVNHIAPAIEAARAKGIDAQGPFPADTVFLKSRDGAYDMTIALYHDQGLMAVKLVG